MTRLMMFGLAMVVSSSALSWYGVDETTAVLSAAQAKQTVAVLGWQPDDAAAPATVVLSRSGDLNFDCGTLLRTTLAAHGGRGGGSKDMAQGSAPVGRLATELDELARHCRASVATK